MAIQWTEDLSTGSTEIDSQHRTLFGRINAMLDACSQGKGKHEVKGVLAFLEDYVVEHFGNEERYMRKHGFSGYAAHKAQHEEFTAKLEELKQQVESGRVGVSTVIAVNQLVVSWFVNHIRKTDTQLGAYLGGRA